MAKFTKSNKAIIPDGTSLWDRGITQPMSDGAPINRIINAAPAIDDNDYIIKAQTFEILVGTGDPKLYHLYVETTGDDDLNDGSASSFGGVDPDTGLNIGPWATPQKAVEWLSNKVADAETTIQVHIGAGEWNIPKDASVLDIQDQSFGKVEFLGNTGINLNFTAATGRAYGDDWVDITLTCAENPINAGVEVGDYLFFDLDSSNYLSGGVDNSTRPWAYVGTWKVTGTVTSTQITCRTWRYLGTRVEHSGGNWTDHAARTELVDLGTAAPVVNLDKLMANESGIWGKIKVLKTIFSQGILNDTCSQHNIINIRNSNVGNVRYIALVNRYNYPRTGLAGLRSEASTVDFSDSVAINCNWANHVTQSSRVISSKVHASMCYYGFSTANSSNHPHSWCSIFGCSVGLWALASVVASVVFKINCCDKGIYITKSGLFYHSSNAWYISITGNDMGIDVTQLSSVIVPNNCEFGLYGAGGGNITADIRHTANIMRLTEGTLIEADSAVVVDVALVDLAQE